MSGVILSNARRDTAAGGSFWELFVLFIKLSINFILLTSTPTPTQNPGPHSNVKTAMILSITNFIY